MRVSLLPLVAAIVLALAAPVASAQPYQDLRSPDARDAGAAAHAQPLQDLAHMRGAPRFTGPTKQNKAALAQEKYYSSYGPAQHPKPVPADDSSPLPAIGVGLALILVIAGSVAVAVRTRRRSVRVAV